jgi:hypothetical protein
MPSERARAYFLVERWKEVYVTTGNRVQFTVFSR